MTFNFGASKVATGFTLPTSTAAATVPQPSFVGASGEPVPTKPLFNTQTTATTVPFSFATNTSATTSSAFTLNSTGATGGTSLSFAAPATTTTTSAFALGSTGFGLGTTATTNTASIGYGLSGALTKPAAPLSIVSGPIVTATSTAPLVTSSLAASSILPSTGALTFSQLEDAINKWTLDLEEQGKVFANQAKHLNAWDRLLIGNGEKILNVSSGIERVKQQQQKLDQDLDFVLAQQNELEDCIAPLEKELQDIPIADTERDQTYKLAENIDTQLKQMSEDLKEVIEHLNESNKAEELSDPVAQIGRILSAHMNSLQWIDRSTSQISSQLDDLSKMHDLNKKKVDSLASQKYKY